MVIFDFHYVHPLGFNLVLASVCNLLNVFICLRKRELNVLWSSDAVSKPLCQCIDASGD